MEVSTYSLRCHDKTEILLKVALSIINQTYSSCYDLFEMSECSHEQPMTTCAFTHTSLERLYLLLYDNE